MAKKKDTVDCRLYYYRADWGNNNDFGTLEQLLTEAHAQLDIAEQRVFTTKTDGKELTGTRHEYREECLLLQISLSDPDQPTSIIRKIKKERAAETSTALAPNGNDFLETEIFALVKHNHVILCTNGRRRALAKEYFRSILEKVNRNDESFALDLKQIADMDKIRIIHSEGVDSIQLGVSSYIASIEHMLRNNQKSNSKVTDLVTVIFSKLKDLFSEDKKQKDFELAEYLNTKIIIAADKGKLKGKYDDIRGDVNHSLIEFSDILLNDGVDGYIIKTTGGSTIKSDEILTSETFKLKKLGSSLSREDAWSNLLIYYKRLKTKGILSR